MENWYFFSASGNYSLAHNYNNGYTSVTVEEYPSIPEVNIDFGSLYEETEGILMSEDSYGGSHSAWGYVLCEGPDEGKKILEEYFEV